MNVLESNDIEVRSIKSDGKGLWYLAIYPNKEYILTKKKAKEIKNDILEALEYCEYGVKK